MVVTHLFDSMKLLGPAHVLRGQYEGYRDEPGVGTRLDAVVAPYRWHLPEEG
jgi:hypothetical protein